MLRKPRNVNNNDAKYEASKAHQNKYVKNNDTHKDPSVFSAGFMVAVQWKDRVLWMHVVVEEAKVCDHSGQSYIIWVMRTGKLIT